MTCRSIGPSALILIMVLTRSVSAGQATPATPEKTGNAGKTIVDTTITDKAVAARRVRTVVHVHLVGKDIRYAVDGDPDSIGNKADGVLLTASSPVKIAYPRLNPLQVEASASTAAVDDPTHSAIAKLIEAIAGIPAVIKPASTDVTNVTSKALLRPHAGTCTAYDEAQRTLNAIQTNLYGEHVSAARLKTEFEAWRDAIGKAFATQPASVAIPAGVAAIDTSLTDLKTKLDNAAKSIADVERHAGGGGATQTPQRIALTNLLAAIDAPANGDKDKIAKARVARKQEIQALTEQAEAADDCASEAATVYGLIRLSNPEARLAQLRKLEKTLTELKTTLTDTYGSDHWLNDTDYVLALDVMPDAEHMQRVTVNVLPIAFDATDGVLSLTRKDAVSATFDVQQYSRFVPELGVGMTFGFVSRPKYGTKTDPVTNQITVTRSKDEEVSLDPTVMVNFVPRGLAGAVPIVQFGASVSKSAPAVLMGGGYRIPGTGDKGALVVGVGLALAWVQDLHKFHEGSVVTGTSDIDGDYTFSPQPKPRLYVNFQYKF
jgi:hypothetical protein